MRIIKHNNNFYSRYKKTINGDVKIWGTLLGVIVVFWGIKHHSDSNIRNTVCPTNPSADCLARFQTRFQNEIDNSNERLVFSHLSETRSPSSLLPKQKNTEITYQTPPPPTEADKNKKKSKELSASDTLFNFLRGNIHD